MVDLTEIFSRLMLQTNSKTIKTFYFTTRPTSRILHEVSANQDGERVKIAGDRVATVSKLVIDCLHAKTLVIRNVQMMVEAQHESESILGKTALKDQVLNTAEILRAADSANNEGFGFYKISANVDYKR